MSQHSHFIAECSNRVCATKSKIAVTQILGDGKRQRSQAFRELQSHYLFEESLDDRLKATTRVMSRVWLATAADTSWYRYPLPLILMF